MSTSTLSIEQAAAESSAAPMHDSVTTSTPTPTPTPAAPGAAGLVPDAPQASAPAAPARTGSAAPAGRENAFAITSFVLGIASVVGGWTFVAPIVGLIFGVLALRRKTAERTLALWGVWLNAAMLILSAIAVAAFVFFLGIGLVLGAPVAGF
jgi:hypothetical protein